MPKSDYAAAVDDIQRIMRGPLTSQGFRVRGRTFNRLTEDGLTQVVGLQMGRSDPPGTTYVEGLTQNLHGLFTVNLGVYVPEFATALAIEPRSWTQDQHCCVRSRLGHVCRDGDLWWSAKRDLEVLEDVLGRLTSQGLPWLDQYATRDQILLEFEGRTGHAGVFGYPSQMVVAVILAARDERDRARRALRLQVLSSADHPGHQDRVRRLAGELGLGDLGV